MGFLNVIGKTLAKISLLPGVSVTINGKNYMGSQVRVLVDDTEVYKGNSFTLTVNGSATEVTTTNGDVQIGGNVSGNVISTNGDITVNGGVEGRVSSVNGDIDIHNVIYN